MPQLLHSFIHQWTCRLFPCLKIINICSMNMGMQTSFRVSVFLSFGYIPRGGIVEYIEDLFLIF